MRVAIVAAVLALCVGPALAEEEQDSLHWAIQGLYDGNYSEQVLFPGQTRVSPSCGYTLVMDWSGWLYIYGADQSIQWYAPVQGGYAALTSTGGLALYDWRDNVVWSSGTSLDPTYYYGALALRNDGRMTLTAFERPFVGDGAYQIWQSASRGKALSAACPDPAGVTYTEYFPGLDCAGYDYNAFYIAEPRQSWCGYFCAEDNRKNPGTCKGFAYVAPGLQGDYAACWLKYDVRLPLHSGPQPGITCGAIFPTTSWD
jgi:hypothetical protein